MRTTTAIVAVSVLLAGGVVSAEATSRRGVRLSPDEARAKATAWRAAWEAREAAGLAPRFHGEDICIIPWVEIDTTSGSGATTLIGVLNQSDFSVIGGMDVYNQFHDGIFAPANTWDPYEVWPLNLRDFLDPANADGDGVIRGFASIFADGPISCDFYQVDPGNNFAQGDVAFTQDDRCWEADTRFGLGGPFDDTEYTFLLTQPSNDLEDDFLVMVFDLDGTMVDAFSDDLVPTGAFVEHGFLSFLFSDFGVSAPPFGSIVVLFAPSTDGGYLFTKISAEDRYSIGLPGTCRVPVG